MSNKNSKAQKAERIILQELSKIFSTHEGARALSLIQQLKMFHLNQEAPPAVSETSKSIQVGIWSSTDSENWELVRNSAFQDKWHLWADIGTINLQKEGKRVVILGESVARGYFYDPVFTPANVLTHQLNAITKDENIEVIDLANTDISPEDLIKLATEAVILSPDAMVIFAGNNWLNTGYSPADWQLLSRAVLEEGMKGVMTYYEENILRPQCRKTIHILHLIAAEFNIPLVLVVPEFNLMHWEAERQVLAPFIGNNRQLEWMHKKLEATRAMEAGDYTFAENLAKEMIDLDNATSSYSYQLLGKAFFKKGELKHARLAFESARDAICGMFIPHSPRSHHIVQEAIRSCSQEPVVDIIDLPVIISDLWPDRLPDRSLFLDYCHMTAAGIQLAMAHTASALCGKLGLPQRDAACFLTHEVSISSKDKAIVHFLAAIHNAHYGQSSELIAYHCNLAIDLWPGICDLMEDYIHCQMQDAPLWMCFSYQRLCEHKVIHKYLHHTDKRKTMQLADKELLLCLQHCLNSSASKSNPTNFSLYLNGKKQVNTKINLLDPRSRANTFREASGFSLRSPLAYIQEHDLKSNFQFYSPNNLELSFKLTCRLPGCLALAKYCFTVDLNGKNIYKDQVGSQWETFCFNTTKFERRDRHTIEISWLIEAFEPGDVFQNASEQMEACHPPVVLPVFAEIHHFSVDM